MLRDVRDGLWWLRNREALGAHIHRQHRTDVHACPWCRLLRRAIAALMEEET